MERCVRLEEAFAELKTDMMEEVKDIDKKLILPAKLARDALKPMKKAIKKREDKKVPQTEPIAALLLIALTRLTTNATKAAPKLCRRRRPAPTERIPPS